MIDTTLIKQLKVLASKEKKINEYKRRLRVKGKITAKGITKKGNITITIKKEGEEYKFTVLKFHKERFAFAGKLRIGRSVYAQGIPKLRMIICTQLKELDKGTEEGKQAKLEAFA
jgi:polyisoprenoid-binding protein YceI